MWIVKTVRYVLLAALALGLSAQDSPLWREPFSPYKIGGNLYYVGTRGLACYLIVTPEGDILINSGLQTSVPLIEENVKKLGFKFSDIKILLVSHSHWDHNAGSSQVKERTGANYMVMEPDVAVTEDGGKSDFFYSNSPGSLYPATKVDRVLHDNDQVRLGGTVLTAHLTPGHTKGCTTWTMDLIEGGKTYKVVIVGGVNVNNGFKLVANTAYPQIAQDYRKTFATLKSLPCDVFLGAHGDYYGMEAKYPRLAKEGIGAFVDPTGYKNFVADREQAFQREWDRQRK